jgi:SAM-dependent methyltransferase
LESTLEKRRAFWADKTTPMSRGNSREFSKLVAAEVRLLFGPRNPIHVLEIGCGNGQLFDYLGFSTLEYRGVDFGPCMLDTFRKRHPDLDLVEAEGSSYVDDRKYDLILAHDVVSQFSRDMLLKHCENARRMMHSTSLLVWSCVLWRTLRRSYDLGIWSNGGKASARSWVKSQIRRMAGREVMGRWYTPGEIRTIAKQNSLSAHFYGSMSHPYRFHAVLRLQPE